MRCILIIFDGIGDRGHACFEGNTPLSVAYTPNLDYLASIGMNGLYHTTLQGMPMPSEEAHFAIFGYDTNDFPGRGYIEASGEGMQIDDSDVVLLCHLCSVYENNKQLMISTGCPDLDVQQAQSLMNEIKTFEHDGILFELKHSKSIHGFLKLKGDVSKHITDSDPLYDDRPVMHVLPLNSSRKSEKVQKTASALNRYLIWCYRKLADHNLNKERALSALPPINALVTQRAGKRRRIVPFHEKWGLRGLSISSGAIYWGLCKEIGMDIIKVRDTGNVEEDFREQLTLAKDQHDYDFIHVHTKMPDEAGHTKNPVYKKEIIEALDRSLSVAVQDITHDRENVLVITGDHSTASAGIMIHSGESVPLVMIGKYVRKDDVKTFSEISCALGALGFVRGKELMYLILNFLDRAKLKGLMDTPNDQPYYPGNYRPLTV